MKNTTNSKICVRLKKIILLFAILGAVLSFLSTQPKFIKLWASFFYSRTAIAGINLLTHDTNRYRTTTKERHIQLLPAEIVNPQTGRTEYQPRCFYLKKGEPGFEFINDRLLANYYENIKDDIVLFIQFQKYHTEWDAQNPATTFRPIYAVPQNNETERLYKDIDPDKKEKSSKIMRKVLTYKKYISNEKALTVVLNNYFRNSILLYALFSIITSILLNHKYVNEMQKSRNLLTFPNNKTVNKKGENTVPNPSLKKTVYIKFFVNVDLNTIKKLTEIIQAKLKEGIERFALLISSPGGNVFAGISGYNFLKGIPAEVITHNFGSADSIATVLFCAGSHRYCVPNARFLLHGIGANITNMRINEKILDENLKSLKVDRENISKVISDNTKKSLEEVEKDILDGKVLTSQQAVDYGLAHEIKTELFERGAEIIEITK